MSKKNELELSEEAKEYLLKHLHYFIIPLTIGVIKIKIYAIRTKIKRILQKFRKSNRRKSNRNIYTNNKFSKK